MCVFSPVFLHGRKRNSVMYWLHFSPTLCHSCVVMSLTCVRSLENWQVWVKCYVLTGSWERARVSLCSIDESPMSPWLLTEPPVPPTCKHSIIGGWEGLLKTLSLFSLSSLSRNTCTRNFCPISAEMFGMKCSRTVLSTNQDKGLHGWRSWD